MSSTANIGVGPILLRLGTDWNRKMFVGDEIGKIGSIRTKSRNFGVFYVVVVVDVVAVTVAVDVVRVFVDVAITVAVVDVVVAVVSVLVAVAITVAVVVVAAVNVKVVLNCAPKLRSVLFRRRANLMVGLKMFLKFPGQLLSNF